MNTLPNRLHLFSAFGIECEYMIVDQQSLRVLPIADKLLEILGGGKLQSEIERGSVAWSNELVRHVIELKGNGPIADLQHIHRVFKEDAAAINRILNDKFAAMLLPTAMHPFFNPISETVLWPYDEENIFATYNRIFNCQGHGWSNLQSVHINLPFANEDEFGRLHAAIRLVLPLIPALAASSPFVEGKQTGIADNRLHFYMQNQKRIPSITGKVIPEAIFTFSDYQKLLRTIYSDINSHDPDGILQHEWLNSRGAIARFDRFAIEIRVTDSQESHRADFAVIAAVVSVVKALVQEKWGGTSVQKSFKEDRLREIFLECVTKGEKAVIKDQDFLQCFHLEAKEMTVGSLWAYFAETLMKKDSFFAGFYDDLTKILKRGTLSTALVKASASRKIEEVYKQVGLCLVDDQIFLPD